MPLIIFDALINSSSVRLWYLTLNVAEFSFHGYPFASIYPYVNLLSYQVLLHEEGEAPLVRQLSVSVSPGFQTSVSMRKTEVRI